MAQIKNVSLFYPHSSSIFTARLLVMNLLQSPIDMPYIIYDVYQ